MLWDMYQVIDIDFDFDGKTMIPQLREGVKKLAEGGEEGAQEIR